MCGYAVQVVDYDQEEPQQAISILGQPEEKALSVVSQCAREDKIIEIIHGDIHRDCSQVLFSPSKLVESTLQDKNKNMYSFEEISQVTIKRKERRIQHQNITSLIEGARQETLSVCLTTIRQDKMSG